MTARPPPSEPFRSARASFRWFVAGGLSYAAGAALVFSGLSSPTADLAEIGLLGLGSALVVVGYVVDARESRKLRRAR